MVAVRLLPKEQAAEMVRELGESETDEDFQIAWLDRMVKVLPADEALRTALVRVGRDGGESESRICSH